MSSDDKLQAMVSQLRMIESYLNEIGSRESLSVRAAAEARASIEAVRAVTSSDTNDFLIPLGGGLMVQSSIARPKKVVVGIGAGITMEKDPEDAIAFVDERIKELEKGLQELGSQRLGLTKQYEATKAAINSLASGKG